MKIYISKYRDHWISPYTMLDYMFFWTDWSKCSRDRSVRTIEQERNYIEPPEWVDRWADRLEPISSAIQWIGERIYPRVEYVKIDQWDTWNMDRTLALIVLPMLKQFKEKKHGSPFVDLEDVPEHLRTTNTEEYDEQSTFDFYRDHEVKEGDCDIHARWEWVMDEMIFAFEHHLDDSWQEKYRSGVIDWNSVPCKWDENGNATLYKMENGPNHTYECDYEAIENIQKRIDNGFRLFGKYYRGLWD